MATAKQRLSNFARASKDRLSGRRLIQPSEGKRKPSIKAFGESPETKSLGEDEQDAFLQTDKSEKDSKLVETEGLSKKPTTSENCCIICVGSTGAGKSSTIAKLTGQSIPAGNSTHRVTQKCNIYRFKSEVERNIIQENNVFFVDTVGWDDAEFDDDDTFKDVLRYIESNSIMNIKAVIWSVIPSNRITNELTNQAKLINKLLDKEIWGRVIIVCKQSMHPEQDTRGALKAALDYDIYANVQVLGYRYLDDPSFSCEQHAEFENNHKMRDTFNVKSDEEVRQIFKEMFCNIGSPTKLVFENQRCLDCGAFGDERLMPKFCHMKKVRVHRVQDAEKVHPGEKEPYHPNKVPIPVHPGYLHRPPWYKNIRLRKVYSCCGGQKTSAACARKWTCCKQTHKITSKQNGLSTSTPLISANKTNDSNTSGCKKKYSCCGSDVPDDPEANDPDGCEQLYSCCGRNRNQDGCREICLKCNKDWGTDAGRCFIKPHNIADLFPDGSKNSKIDSRSTDQDNIHVMPERKRDDVKDKKNRTFLEKCQLPDVIPMIPYPVL